MSSSAISNYAKFSLRVLAVESRMIALTIAAASHQPTNSPAMLITRQSGRSSCALALLDAKDDVHR
jgi:hypothetical protein